ncbi:MAG TPA: preprotein translocase subunit SecA [Candidatus Saccharibacteria bacterium]|nr:preprotein translocase subunit SecA [Candidatus Saccharibacteria bacterium]
MNKIAKKILGDPQARTLKRLTKKVKDINVLAPKYQKMSDAQLKKQTALLKQKLEKSSLDKILPEAFALVRETASRVIGQRHFDVQLIGGMVLHEGAVAEMKTGEGKTLVATLPLFLNALEGKGAHLITVNDYLARLHGGWMGEIYDFLGLSVGVIMPDDSFIFDKKYVDDSHDDARFRHLKPCSRQEAYAADITYGTNNEFGFDYLRDNMVREVDQLRQRELNFAIVDEVDSILIDEARTPLIISAPAAASATAYEQFARIVSRLNSEKHYEKDEKRKAVVLTDEGIEEVEKILGVESLYSTENIRTIYHLEQALRARALFERDKNYVVTNNGEVVIVDEFTGRLLKGRRYNEGLHQAIEAKEGVAVQEESMTLATISFQNLFRLYDKLSGMTGTAATEQEEFHQIYELDVIEIPPNKKVIRDDKADKIFKTEAGKFRAIVKELKKLHKIGQPVLIGTVSIEKNELLSKLLNEAKVPHQVLNAKNNEKEAHIVANAGQKGAVTLATNIAGRGTDIVLSEEVKKLGGLFVLGSERHESRRIDNQLRGRSGRQGDPGASQFFVSCEDDLMRIFGGERIAAVMNRLAADEETPIENRFISKSLEGAQKKVEGFNFDQRKNLVQYDDVMNRHRKATYIMRREILKQNDISPRIKQLIDAETDVIAQSEKITSYDYQDIIVDVFPFSEKTLDKLFSADVNKFPQALKKEAMIIYAEREKSFTSEIMRKVESDIYLQVLDNLWMQHLEEMDHLREGIGWISVGQRDPLVEYRRQAQILFESMQATLRHDVLKALFSAEPLRDEDIDAPIETELTRAARNSIENADKIIEGEEFNANDFKSAKTTSSPVVQQRSSIKKTNVKKKSKSKSRKAERKRRAKGRRK